MTRKAIIAEDYNSIIHVPHDGIYHGETTAEKTDATETALKRIPASQASLFRRNVSITAMLPWQKKSAATTETSKIWRCL